jgi:general stress protein 26
MKPEIKSKNSASVTAGLHDRDALLHTKQIAESIRFCMMTTVSPEGELFSRPMTAQQMDDEGNFWFFAADDAEQTFSFDSDESVNLAFASPDSSKYLSISGSATIVKDPQKIDELWNPMASAWFPKGKTDPRLCLIRVHPHVAEYWDSPSSKVVRLLGVAKALLIGKTPNGGDHAKVTC